MRGLVVVGEGYRDVAALAGSGADKLALEARNEALGAELEMVALCRPALERSTVDLADEVDDHDIALGGATRLLDRLAVLLLRRHALERFVDGLVVDAGDGALDLEGPEVQDRKSAVSGKRVSVRVDL